MIIPSTSSSSSRQPQVNLKTSYSTNAMMTNSQNWYAPSNLHVPPLNPNDPFLSKLASAAASFPEAFLNRPINSDTPPYLDVYDSPTLMASPAQVERSVGYDDAELTTPPPDLPSILLHGRIVYIGMAVKVNDHTYGFLASYVVVALKSLPPSAKTIRDLSIWVFENAKHKNVEHIVILSIDHLYRMNYMDFVQKHIDTKADITVSCIPMDDSRASDYGLMKIDSTGRIIQFAEKPKGPDLKAMKVDTTVLGLSIKEAEHFPYIASMGVYVFRTDVLLKLLKWSYPSSNDFGSEIIPAAVDDHNVQELHH